MLVGSNSWSQTELELEHHVDPAKSDLYETDEARLHGDGSSATWQAGIA